MTSEKYPDVEGGSFNLVVGPEEPVVHPAITELLLALESPGSASDLSERLGISRGAVVKRIFNARNKGFQINLSSNGVYWNAGDSPSMCQKCGKRMSKYNKQKICFSCQMCP